MLIWIVTICVIAAFAAALLELLGEEAPAQSLPDPHATSDGQRPAESRAQNRQPLAWQSMTEEDLDLLVAGFVVPAAEPVVVPVERRSGRGANHSLEPYDSD